jgi:hypothetical protein
MKKISVISKTGLITLWVLCLLYQHAQAQSPNAYAGIWEGNFMEQFKTVILLDQADASTYAGKILMYSGEERIQDDELSKISIENNTLSFYIAAKETSFKGTFNEKITELSGNFVFPDNSKHPLKVNKFNKDSIAVKTSEASPSLKEKLNFDATMEELKSDFKDLVNKLKKYHPRLYSYTSEEAFNKQVQEIKTQLDQDMNPEQFYLRIAPLIESVKCSHTGIRLPGEYQLYIHDKGLFFPLKLYIQNKKAYCLSLSEEMGAGILPGSEILTINQRPAGQIIQELLAIIPSEGNNMTTKYQELNRDFQSYFHMLDPSESFLVEYSSHASIARVNLQACSYEQVQDMDQLQAGLKPYSFHMKIEPSYGILRVSSFGIMDMEDYFSFLDSTFILMNSAGLTKLVLDLRDNQGGHPIFAAQLFSYLTDKEFIYFQRNLDVKEFEPLYNSMQPNKNHFNGNIFVLVNGSCLSTTGHLISQLDYHTEALFLGEEPGSTFLCNDFSIQYKLPNSGMEVNIPRTTFVTAVSGFEKGNPKPVDYQVEQTLKNKIEGVDSYMYVVDTISAEHIANP